MMGFLNSQSNCIEFVGILRDCSLNLVHRVPFWAVLRRNQGVSFHDRPDWDIIQGRFGRLSSHHCFWKPASLLGISIHTVWGAGNPLLLWFQVWILCNNSHSDMYQGTEGVISPHLHLHWSSVSHWWGNSFWSVRSSRTWNTGLPRWPPPLGVGVA